MPTSTVNRETARGEAEYALNRKQHEKGVFLSTEQQKMVLEFAREMADTSYRAGYDYCWEREIETTSRPVTAPDKETYLTQMFKE